MNLQNQSLNVLYNLIDKEKQNKFLNFILNTLNNEELEEIEDCIEDIIDNREETAKKNLIKNIESLINTGFIGKNSEYSYKKSTKEICINFATTRLYIGFKTFKMYYKNRELYYAELKDHQIIKERFDEKFKDDIKTEIIVYKPMILNVRSLVENYIKDYNGIKE